MRKPFTIKYTIEVKSLKKKLITRTFDGTYSIDIPDASTISGWVKVRDARDNYVLIIPSGHLQEIDLGG